jgi:isopenicillin N synthase-like dioxygenase
MSSFSSLPIIDLKADESTIIHSIFNACSTTGFFYLRNHNLLDAQQRMFKLAKEFFRSPSNIKEEYIINKDNHGYVRRGQENLDSTNTKLIDEKEAFNIGKSMQPDQLPPPFSQSDNCQFIQKFHHDCYDLCMQLLTYLAQSFNIDSDYFTSRHKWELKSGDTLRLLHYPAVKNQSNESIRAGAHSDYGSITLLFQHENRSGLEVLDRSTNTWHPVAPFDDMIVINFGDAFEYWSKGFIKSTVHRVVMPIIDSTQENERFSIAFFCHPNDSTLLTPIPSKIIQNQIFEKDEHAKHTLDHNNENIVTAGEHLQMRLNKTYAY